MYRIGTAGWTIPRASAERAAGEGSHLQRYARVFDVAEINSSFHRPHSEKTYARWAEQTPAGFLFSVKMPRTITHDARLRRSRAPLARFLGESAGLGDRRGPLLVQLPPSFAFDRRVAARFLDLLRAHHTGPVVWEPRHPTWFTPAADALLSSYEAGRVGADPARVPEAAVPGGWPGIIYYRLHGSPRVYWSNYPAEFLVNLESRLRAGAWCIFDNTAAGAAFDNALDLQALARAVPESARAVP
ncbi:MAG: DUF72 domain-containing protein [Acidobacteriota bacterium]|nr:DUF72 domain-containing protein [Acidobacteriota bacterium]